MRAVATPDGYISIQVMYSDEVDEQVLLAFDSSKENALKLAGQIIEATDQLDGGRKQ